MHNQSNDYLVCEIVVRVIIWVAFIYLELCAPFIRIIQPEELWLYKYPRSYEYVPANILWLIVIIVPITVLTIDYLRTRNRLQYCNGILCLSLLLGLNGFITVFIKLIVGRPRPDFFYRCYPDGNGSEDLIDCTGDGRIINEGRKSFPSGHASFSFASMTLVTLILNEKLFSQQQQQRSGEAWRIILSLLPILLATGIAISRTCDYHHHWQDVCVGGLIGSTLAYICYKQYFIHSSH